MSPALIKTKRQFLGLPTEWVASTLSTTTRTIQRWESGEHACDKSYLRLLRDLEHRAESTIAKAAQQILSSKEDDVLLIRYSEVDFEKWNKDYRNLPEQFHAMILARIADLLQGEEVRVEMIWFDPKDYLKFLGGQKDTPEKRLKWASSINEKTQSKN